jgi:hypothetical protein
MKSFITCLLLAGCALLASCGTEGAPQPPSLDLPQPVQDLRASRKGDKVTLDWTQPRQTTDREAAAKHIGETVVCQTISDSPGPLLLNCPQQVEQVPATQPASNGKSQTPPVTPVEVTFNLPDELVRSRPLSFAGYAVMVNNHSGRNAGISNSAAVPLAPTLPPPTNLKTEVRGDGVYVSATPTAEQPPDAGGRLQFVYRLDRVSGEPAAPGPQPVAPVKVAEIPASGNLAAADRGFEWEKNYVYSITPVTRILPASGGAPLGEVEGEASAAIQVRTRDIFPPAPPVGLQAVFSGNPQQNFIDLTWAPNTEADLAGYNVYRRDAGRTWSRINSDLVKTPVFRDSEVQPGKQYFYAVTAVDLRNNESGRSEETHESVPSPQP